MISISNALHALNITEWVLRGEPTNESEFNAMFSKVVGEDANGSAIESSDPADFGVTWTQVKAKQAELESDYTAKEYQRSRAAEYPSLAEQLDYIYHNGVEAWKTDIIDPIKARYPKP